jgi:sodium/potassium/calcium exchanger 6
MHGRTTSNPAPMGNGGRLSMTPASPTDIRPRNTRRNSLSLIPSNTDPSIVSSLPGGAEWDEQVRGRRNSVDNVTVPNLIDLGTAVHDPWRDSSTSSIGRRDRSSASRTSLPRLEIPSGLSSLNQSPASPSSANKVKKSKMKVKLKAGEEIDLNGHIVRKRPSILLTSAAGDESTVLAPESPSLSFFTFIKPVHFIHVSRAVFLALFPSLHEWKAKSRVGKVTAVLCVPAILLLNLTLPVVDCCEDEECDAVEEKERLEEAIRKAGGYRDLEDGQITPDEFEDEDRNIRTLGSDGTKAGYEIAVSDTPLKDAVDRLARLEREAVAHEFRSVASPWIDADHHTTSSAHAHSQGTDYGSMEPSGLGVGIDGVAFDDDEEEDESEQEQVEEVDAEVLTRWLTAVQCTLAPVFCVCALFGPSFISFSI